jgi:cytochrome c5
VIVQGVGAVRAALALDGALGASLGPGGALVATDAGLFALTTTSGAPQLVVSPLGASLPPVVDLARVGDTLWLATTTGLFRYDAVRFDEVRPAGQPVIDADLAGPVFVDGAAVVVAASTRGLFAIESSPALRVLDLGVDDVGAVTADVDGGLWVTTAGRLWQRRASGDWGEWLSFDDVVAVAAAPRTSDVWLIVGDALVHARDGVFRGAGRAPLRLAASTNGAALVVRDDGLRRLREGRALNVDPLREAEVIVNPTLVSARALPRHLAATLVVSLDDVALGLATTAEATFTLDPTTLAPGLHRLTTTATYPDGDVRVVERDFYAQTAVFPTWTNDVRPVFDAVCSACHTPAGGARLLDSSARWRAEIDAILRALEPDPETGFAAMPLGDPLSDDERRRIRLWAATGMQE